MAKTWQTVAVWNHVPKHVADKITGHGAGVAMAMFLAAQGVDDETISRMARW